MQKLLLVVAVFLGRPLFTHANIRGMEDLLVNFTVSMVKTQQTVLFGCDRDGLLSTTAALQQWNQLTQTIRLSKDFKLAGVLTRSNHAKTAVIMDCSCFGSTLLLEQVDAYHYFNKTYQWLLFDVENSGVSQVLPKQITYLGPNAQVTYLNGSRDGHYFLWDLHSKGLHLGSPMEVTFLAEWQSYRHGGRILKYNNIFTQQGIQKRGQFNGLSLRSVVVIDRDNITTNDQIVNILSQPSKSSGVATFVKYHYDLLCVLVDRFNFTVNFRNTRGWAGRMGNTTFRLGLLGVLARNEADVAATGALARKNRFTEFDTIHQSWKFESGFLYRFTTDLDSHGKSGNFLAPFDDRVWCYTLATLLVVTFVWRLVEWLKNRWSFSGKTNRQQFASKSVAVATTCNEEGDDEQTSLAAVWLSTFAAVCQQGMEPIPTNLPLRTIVLTIFLFSLLMYNFYTSSVVGGLLSSTEQGPATVAEIVTSPLKLSFEDIGYYKVLFHEAKTTLTRQLHKTKILPERNPTDLPVYTHIEDAAPYLKKGGYAFHCEVVDAYPIIGKLFDAEDICDLRMVFGLLETEIINWPIPKRSQYLELFRVVMTQVREVGLIDRHLNVWRTKKPQCQALYRVFPISLPGVVSAFLMLFSGYTCAVIALIIERTYRRIAASTEKQDRTSITEN